MKQIWEGVYPAITTKFHADDTIDFEGFARNIEKQIEAGIDGLVLGGSLGEASTLLENEKYDLLKFTLGLCGDQIPVVLNIAEQSTEIAVNIAKKAENIGAAGLMVLPPMRYKSDDRETVQFFKRVAQSVRIPVMIYNNPIDYKIEVSLDMFEELSRLPNITAIKESTRDTTNISRIKNRFGDRFKILCGVDTLAVESLVMGADGWVAGLVAAFPHETVAIYRMVKSGRINEAVELFRWFLPLLELDIHPKLVQYIKMAESLTGLGTEHVREPRLTLEGKEREDIMNLINNAIKIRPTLPDYLNY